MVTRCQSTDVKYQWNQIHELDRALSTMRRFGIDELSLPYQQLYSLRGKLMGQLGFKAARPVSLLAKLIGLSPGEVKLWHDAESGWMSEAREKPGAPPIYHYIGDEQAVAILNKEISPELHDYLFTPDDYIGD